MLYERRYVWQLVVRIFHWINLLAILLLAITGLYIGNPFLMGVGEAYHNYIMGTVRFIHAISAVIFGVNCLMRFYWLFMGNKYARWTGFLPLSKERLNNTVKQIRFYALIDREPPFDLGHNPIAGLSYMGLFVIMLLQGITGLAMYAEYYPGSLWSMLFDPVFNILGQSQQLRLVHHMLMWVFAAFAVVHLYMAVLYDLLEGDATFSSMVNGFKIFPANEHKE